jgi:selenide, water dikinase
VLVGGGHSHVLVLRRFAMRPLPGVRITVVSRELHTPYSGMLPGYIAGHYGYDDIHIDLGPLATAAGARLVADEAINLDLHARRVEFARHPAVRYDVLSLNCGAAPGFGGVQTADAARAIPVKPIGGFLPRWHTLREQLRARNPSEPAMHIVVIGGGAGGVELALSVRHAVASVAPSTLITLVNAGSHLLEGHTRAVRRRFEMLLPMRGIDVLNDFAVASVDADGVRDDAGRYVRGDFLLWVTGVEAPRWLRATGLALDADGFVAVDRTLRSSDPHVFAAGDVASMADQPRPKSGVYAVRQGPVLADNLRRALLGEDLKSFRAQRRVLALITEGPRSATASRGPLSAHGDWVWRWKNFIDRRFMARFTELPQMQTGVPDVHAAFAADVPDDMRCGGCGAKLGADLLNVVLAQLRMQPDPRLAVGIGDDAAVFEVSKGQVVLTADSLRTMVDDPYEFGRIATRHALNDVHAMGCKPATALALVTIPLMGRAQMEADLLQVMRGAADVLAEEHVSLSGGHSSEGLELALGFAVVGDVTAAPLRKGGLAAGDALVLTRALGSGVLFAARARGLARTRWIRRALERMDASNADAARLLREHGARACTDVTGFGLLGHLGEMLRASNVAADVHVSSVPLYEGAYEMMNAGVSSSLQANNESALRDFAFDGCAADSTRVRLLVDPQTAGGLLAGVPAQRAQACVAALRGAGYRDAAVIGHVVAGNGRRGVLRDGG